MPPAAAGPLRWLGETLAIARVGRHESQRAWARRLGISVPTLIRMERGDPGVGAGIYVTALWMIGRADGLADLAAPAADLRAIESDVRDVLERRATRSAASRARSTSRTSLSIARRDPKSTRLNSSHLPISYS